MFPSTISDWLAFLGVVIPFATVSVSAAVYVWNQTRDSQYREYKKFFEITDSLSREDGSLVSKVAAVYELRKYKEYKDVIIRICDGAEVRGASAKLLKDEMMLTKEYFMNGK